MSKALETLLEQIANQKYNSRGSLWAAYLALMEERKNMPQWGQEIEVRDDETEFWRIRKFIGFTSGGMVVVEAERDKYTAITCNYYRIPVAKKKWKVVRDGRYLVVLPFDHITDLPIITTFED
jgi:hypothetical protein